ncbi:YkvA family protein [Caballeronia sp. LZ019]|uniref:YkvA family protein n=1 Tax=Caballeronia sp. LZ019 TaxID=3038555 RepID=UPI00285B933B|nr:YkvA family protein [Caballeronia sp. LZ019]MDR5807460.1 YkvA family protein [Caballeronia sp. LZ019]
MSIFETIRTWARRIKRDAMTLWFAYRNPATPLFVKLLCVFVVGYALSPVNLIPDFIPVLGYLDDALLLPGLIWLAIRLLPAGIVQESRLRADAWMAERRAKPKSYTGAAVIVIVWLAVAYAAWAWLGR